MQLIPNQIFDRVSANKKINVQINKKQKSRKMKKYKKMLMYNIKAKIYIINKNKEMDPVKKIESLHKLHYKLNCLYAQNQKSTDAIKLQNDSIQMLQKFYEEKSFN